jgi:hypothetical protein
LPNQNFIRLVTPLLVMVAPDRPSMWCGSVCGVAGVALDDGQGGLALGVVDLATGPQGLPLRVVDLAAEAGGLGVGVEGDALDGVGVVGDGEVAVEDGPQAVALDREDEGVGLAVLEDVVDEGVVGQPEHLGGVVGGGGAGGRVFLGAALVEALGLDGLVFLAGLELDDLAADVLVEQALDLVGGDGLVGLEEAGDQRTCFCWSRTLFSACRGPRATAAPATPMPQRTQTTTAKPTV